MVTRDPNYNTYYIKSKINSVTTDKDGNIYIVGHGHSSAYFYTPDGDSTKIAECYVPTYNNGYIAKLDSSGTLLWSAVFTNSNPQKVRVDRNGDMIVVGSYFTSGGQWYVNGGTDSPIHTMSSSNFFIMRLDDNGAIKWRAPIELPSSNPVDCADFDVDKYGNVYITGGYEHTSTFYSPDLSVQVVIPGSYVHYGSKFFIMKYDSLGVPKWAARDHFSSLGSLGYNIVTDSLGTSYVTGFHRNLSSTAPMSINSADASVANLNLGGYFTLKFNSAGVLQWGVGNQYSYYGSGLGIALSDNEVSVMGIIRDATAASYTTEITTTSGPVVNLNISRGDFFVANYDTNGVIKNVFLSGTNTTTNAAEYPSFIFKDSIGMYYTVGLTFAAAVEYCGDTIDANGLYDVFVARFGTHGCPGYLYTEQDKLDVHTEMQIFPNPVSQDMNIVLSNRNIIDLNIYDYLGRKVYTLENINQNMTVVSKNKFFGTEGIYLVEIKTDKERLLRKIVVLTN